MIEGTEDPTPEESGATDWPSISIDSWEQLNQIADQFHIGSFPRISYVFRGQASKDWQLTPSISRYTDPLISDDKLLKLEQDLLQLFRNRAPLFDIGGHLKRGDIASWWALMQHHGAPTRMLDWSTSMYVAAYFAVADRFTDDGCIWIVHAATVIEHANKKLAEAHGDIDWASNQETVLMNPGAYPWLLGIDVRRKTQRMISQQSLFTVSNNPRAEHSKLISDAILARHSPDNPLLFRVVIPKHLKRDFLNRLAFLNVTADALFPTVDGLGKGILERAITASADVSDTH